MSKENIKASNNSMSDKQFKLCDLIPEFSRFRSNGDKIHIGCQFIDDSLFVSTRKGERYFKLSTIVCPEYVSHDVVKNGTYSRKLIFKTT